VLLAVELLLFERKPRSFIPAGIAALVAALWRPWLIGAGPLFPFAAVPVMVARRDLLRVRARLVSDKSERRKLLALAG